MPPTQVRGIRQLGLSVEEIAAIRSVPVAQVITEVEAAIAALLAEQAGAAKDGSP